MNKSDDVSNADIIAGFAALREDVAGLVAAMARLVHSESDTAAKATAEAVGDMKAAALQTGSDVKARIGSFANDFGGCVERNPLSAMLIAFGIGLFAAVVSRPSK